MQGNIQIPVPTGKDEDTDTSVEPRQGGISSFLLAPLSGKRKRSQKETNPKGQSKTKSSPNPNNLLSSHFVHFGHFIII